jgi:hypothetical protein
MENIKPCAHTEIKNILRNKNKQVFPMENEKEAGHSGLS